MENVHIFQCKKSGGICTVIGEKGWSKKRNDYLGFGLCLRSHELNEQWMKIHFPTKWRANEQMSNKVGVEHQPVFFCELQYLTQNDQIIRVIIL